MVEVRVPVVEVPVDFVDFVVFVLLLVLLPLSSPSLCTLQTAKKKIDVISTLIL